MGRKCSGHGNRFMTLSGMRAADPKGSRPIASLFVVSYAPLVRQQHDSVRFIWPSTKKLWTGGRALSPADPIRSYE
jgi:hypothetical protein